MLGVRRFVQLAKPNPSRTLAAVVDVPVGMAMRAPQAAVGAVSALVLHVGRRTMSDRGWGATSPASAPLPPLTAVPPVATTAQTSKSDSTSGVARGWGAASSPAPAATAAAAAAAAPVAEPHPAALALHDALRRGGKGATPLAQLSGLLPDEVLDDLDVGMRQLVELHPQLFTFCATPSGAIGVMPVPRLDPPPDAFLAAVEDMIVQNDGDPLPLDEVRKKLPAALMEGVVAFRSIANALAAVPQRFTIANGSVRLHESRAHLIVEARRLQLAPVVRQTPSFMVPVAAVAAVEGVPTEELLAHFRQHSDVFDLVELVTRDGDDDGGDHALATPAAVEAFVRVLPMHADACTPESANLYNEDIVPDYDAYRLARFLITASFRSLKEVAVEADPVLSKSTAHVAASFPEMFEIDAAGANVRFILRDDMRPNPLSHYSDAELDARIEQLREGVKGYGEKRSKFDKKHFKDKLAKAQGAKLIRANPAGTVCMDRNVLAYLIFDLLPEHSAISLNDVVEMLPEFARNTSVRVTRELVDGYPHLFNVFQDKPPNYMIQRANLEIPDAVRLDANGKEWTSYTAADAADAIIEIAKIHCFEGNRPTGKHTIMNLLKRPLRQHLRDARITLEQIVAARPDCLRQVKIGGSDNSRSEGLMFVGPLAEVLPPCTRPALKFDVFDHLTGELISAGDPNSQLDYLTFKQRIAKARKSKPEATEDAEEGKEGGAQKLRTAPAAARGWHAFNATPSSSTPGSDDTPADAPK